MRKPNNNATVNPIPSTLIPPNSQDASCKSPSKLSYENIRKTLRKSVEESEKKIDRKQIWNNFNVDVFQEFIEQQSTERIDYILIGRCIEAFTRIYALRLDSLYAEVKKFCFALLRQGVGCQNKLKTRQQEDDEDQQDSKSLQIRPRKVKRHLSTVVANPGSLNAKLITNPLSDPFFAKLNSFVGEMSQANQMFLNLMPSKRTRQVGLPTTAPFWDSADQVAESNQLTDVIKIAGEGFLDIQTKVIRSSEFRIESGQDNLMTFINLCSEESDVDMEDDCHHGENSQSGMFHDSFEVLTHQFTDTGYGTALDVTQDIKTASTLAPKRRFTDLIDVGTCLETILTEPLEIEHQETEFVEDLQPLTTEKLDYSYRPLVKNYFAGPNHWKFIEKKVPRVETPVKTRKNEASLEDVRRFINTFKDSVQLSRKSEKYMVSLKKLKSWSPNKLKLPPDFNFSTEILDGSTSISFNIIDIYNQDQSEDEGHFDNTIEMHDSQFDEETTPLHYRLKTTVPKTSMIVIRNNARRPERISMKEIKEASLTVIKNESEYGEDIVKFSVVNEKVFKMYEQSQTSCALTFFSLLQASNEMKVQLLPDENIDDFGIKLI